MTDLPAQPEAAPWPPHSALHTPAFPRDPRMHRSVDTLQRASVEWARNHGVVHSPEHTAKISAQQTAMFSGFGVPDASQPVAQLASDWLLCFVCLDDWTEAIPSAVQLRSQLDVLQMVLRTGHVPRTPVPFGTALQDLRHRSLALGPSWWLDRFLEIVTDLFEAAGQGPGVTLFRGADAGRGRQSGV